MGHDSWVMIHGSWAIIHGSFVMTHGNWRMAQGNWLMAHRLVHCGKDSLNMHKISLQIVDHWLWSLAMSHGE